MYGGLPNDSFQVVILLQLYNPHILADFFIWSIFESEILEEKGTAEYPSRFTLLMNVNTPKKYNSNWPLPCRKNE